MVQETVRAAGSRNTQPEQEIGSDKKQVLGPNHHLQGGGALLTDAPVLTVLFAFSAILSKALGQHPR